MQPSPAHVNRRAQLSEPANTAWPTKPFSQFDEVIRKRASAPMAPIKQRGSIMLAFILNAVYRQFIRAALSGIATQGAKP